MKFLKNNYFIKEIQGNLLSELADIIIKNEGVHLIKKKTDLFSRSSCNKRIYGLFSQNNLEYFTFIYYSCKIPTSIKEILATQESTPFKTVTFYSINKTISGTSNSKQGAGLGLGKELIQRVSALSVQEFPEIEITCTLSPIIGFSGKSIQEATDYLLKEKNGIFAKDPVANFHFRNGAQFYKIVDKADSDPKRSGGLMVNYYYPACPKKLFSNSTNYLQKGIIERSESLINN